jgi:TRAP-type C4-dicarboxylate transport system permease small subunit
MAATRRLAQEMALEKLLHFEKRLNQAIEVLITLFFFLILSLTIILVLLRYGFNSSIIGGSEAMEYLFIYTTALGAAVSVGKNDHIRISVLVDALQGRARQWARILHFTLIAFLHVVMFWFSLPWIRSAGVFESPVLRLPNWMVQVSVPIGCALVIIYCFNHLAIEVLQWDSKE